MNELIKNKYFDFGFIPNKCSECDAKCCIGEKGYIFLNISDISRIASYLQISEKVFSLKHLRKIDDKFFSLKEVKISSNNYACEFLDLETNYCTIYDVRPKQCISFPFWESNKKNIEKVKQECMAIIDL